MTTTSRMPALSLIHIWGVAPRGEGGLGPGKGAVDLFPARLAYLGQHLTGIGGVDRRQQGFRGHILAVDVERQGPALRRAHRSDALRLSLIHI